MEDAKRLSRALHFRAGAIRAEDDGDAIRGECLQRGGDPFASGPKHRGDRIGIEKDNHRTLYHRHTLRER